MTFSQATYDLQGALTASQMRAFGSFANTYGLRRVHVDEAGKRLTVEFDASRLRETEIVHALSQAGIAVRRSME